MVDAVQTTRKGVEVIRADCSKLTSDQAVSYWSQSSNTLMQTKFLRVSTTEAGIVVDASALCEDEDMVDKFKIDTFLPWLKSLVADPGQDNMAESLCKRMQETPQHKTVSWVRLQR